MRRRDFLKELPRCGAGRRERTGPPPPAARVLRIALRATALRAALAPGASGGPAGQQSGQPRGAAPEAAAAPSRGCGHASARPSAGSNMEGYWLRRATAGTQADTCSITWTGRKITRMTGSQPQN
jgi:hypothetical protein